MAGAQVLELVNEERAKAGCSPVAANGALAALATAFSEDMARRGFFDHTDPDGDTPWDRAQAAGVSDLGGENIARGQADAEAVMRAWMDSPGHKANILNCDFRTLGVGVHFGPGGPVVDPELRLLRQPRVRGPDTLVGRVRAVGGGFLAGENSIHGGPGPARSTASGARTRPTIERPTIRTASSSPGCAPLRRGRSGSGMPGAPSASAGGDLGPSMGGWSGRGSRTGCGVVKDEGRAGPSVRTPCSLEPSRGSPPSLTRSKRHLSASAALK
ncbi:hypothetical protein GCM10019016_094510 [Streptomyces prasinosporus]|uniref:SCP domain-containing protein n=1 Tax=Streptomyces prasinosporus TaxID=68256 RepID=A0ABP6U6J6_9ACTN